MATTQESYRFSGRNPRYTTKLNAFSNGMYLTEQVIPEGYVKKMINYDVDATGSHIKPRRGRKIIETIHPLPKDMNAPYLDHGQPDAGKDVYRPPELMTRLNLYDNSTKDNGIISGTISAAINRSYRGIVYDEDQNYESLPPDWYERDPLFKPIRFFGENEETSTSNELYHIKEHVIMEPQAFDVQCATLTRPVMSVVNNELYSIDLVNNFENSGDSPNGKPAMCNWKLQRDGQTTLEHHSNYWFIKTNPIIYKPNALEAASTGYNMLLDEPFTFENEIGGSLTILGGTYHLLNNGMYSSQPTLYPELGSNILILVNYQYPTAGQELTCKVEICDASNIYSPWETVMEDGYVVTGEVWEVAPLTVKYKNMSVRITATPNNDSTKTTTGTFQIIASNDTNSGIELNNIDLLTGEAMCNWFSYLGIYHVPGHENTIFFSDIDNPGYFPFPNNILQFDKDILAVHNYLDHLLVITVDSIYLITMGDSIITSTQKKIMTNINITEIDALNLVVLKDQIFFKTSDQFYVLKPNNYTSDATDLKNYVISTAIDNLTKNFKKETLKMLNDTYKTVLKMLRRKYRAPIIIDNFSVAEIRSTLVEQEVHYIYTIRPNFHNEKNEEEYVCFDTSKYVFHYGYVQMHLVYDTLVRSWRIYFIDGNPYNQGNRYNFEGGGYMDLKKEDGSIDYEHEIQAPLVEPIYFRNSKDGHYYEIWWVQDPTMKHWEGEDEKLPYDYGNGETGYHLVQQPYNTILIVELTYEEVTDRFNFGGIYNTVYYDNYNYIDTGIIAIEDIFTKRFREVQLNLVNCEKTMIPFHVDFKLDGQERVSATHFRIQHITDPNDPDYGLIYVTPIETDNLKLYGETNLGNDIIESDHWNLDLSKFPDLTMITVRFELKGRGRHASLQLLNTSLKRYELADINWVYRMMNAR